MPAAVPEPAAPAGDPLQAAGPVLLEKIRPLMRRNRRGPGGSGSLSFLSRGLKCSEADLLAGFGALGLVLPSSPEEKPVVVEIGGEEWWLNKDQRGGVWINGEERKSGSRKAEIGNSESGNSDHSSRREVGAGKEESAADGVQPEAPRSDSVFAAVRLLLKPTKTGALAGRTDRLAETLGKSPDEFLAALTSLGLKIPEKPREKPAFVEDGGEIFWLNKNTKDELWLNAKASKFAVGEEPPKKKSRRAPASP